MTNVSATLSMLVFVGASTIGCDSKHHTEQEGAPLAEFKSSAVHASDGTQLPAAAPTAAEREETPASLPLAIPGSDGRLLRFELASSIVDREPAGVAHSFSRSTTPRVFAFVEVANKHGRPFEVEVRFEPAEATTKARGFKLAIPGAERWRTQALMATRKAGTYRAVVSAPDGSELIVREFTVSD